MNRRIFLNGSAAAIALTAAVFSVSCRQMFTTSLAAPLARDSITISSSASTSDILEIAATQGLSDASSAQAVLSALGGKTETEITALSAEDRETVLNLASAATISMKTLTNLASAATADEADPDALIEDFFADFDSSADLRAVETILADTENLSDLAPDALITASAVVVADLASEVPAADLMTLLSGGTPETELTEAQQARFDLVLGVKTNIESRSDEELSSIEVGGFNLADLLAGSGGDE